MSLGNFLGSVGGAIGGLFGDAIGGTITGATLGSGLGSIGSALGTGMGLVGSAKGLYDSFNNTSLKNQMKYDQFKSELDYQYWSRKMSNRHTLFLFAINIYLKKLFSVIVRKALIFVKTVLISSVYLPY